MHSTGDALFCDNRIFVRANPFVKMAVEVYSDGVSFTVADRELLGMWLYESTRKEFIEGYYRVDLPCRIFIFTMFSIGMDEFLAGYLLPRNPGTWALLEEIRKISKPVNNDNRCRV